MTLADLVTAFFVRHLGAERDASAHTVAAYRDAFRLLLPFLATATGRPIMRLTIDDFTPTAILAFLEHLELERGNSVRTRNARLAAIRSFFTFAVTREPAVCALGRQILSIPFKKTTSRLLGYLTEADLKALLAAPDRSTGRGQRDYLLLALLYDTGARVQELVGLRPVDFRLERPSLVHIMGKGRKQRVVPLLPATTQLVRDHLLDTGRALDDGDPVFRNYRGEPMSRSGVAFILEKYRRLAAQGVPSLARSGISPHTMRHTKAMHLLQAGISPVTIKDILGHAHLKTMECYVQADLEMKRAALEATPTPVEASLQPRHEPDLLSWLEQL